MTDLVALVHVELESRASTLAFRPRMFEYYVQLRRNTGLPVLPIALFLRVGLDGIGWDAYEEHFWEQRIVRFESPTWDCRPWTGSSTRRVRTYWGWHEP